MDEINIQEFSSYAKGILKALDGGEVKYDRTTFLGDVSEGKLSYEEAFYLLYQLDKKKESDSKRDKRTGIFNSEFFEMVFPVECARAARLESSFTLLLVDADDFRRFNNQYNYLVGNKVLKTIAQTIRKNIRRTDFVCRYGGEEFVIICPSSTLNQGAKIGEKIREKISQEVIEVPEGEEKVTVSIGVTVFDVNRVDVKSQESIDRESSTLLNKATEALHQAKKQGKNRVVAIG